MEGKQENKMFKLRESMTTVTPLSKYLAMVLFVIFPFVGFSLGVRYQILVGRQGKQIQTQGDTVLVVPTQTQTSGNSPEMEDASFNLNNTVNWNTYKIQVFFDPSIYMSEPGYFESEFKYPEGWRVEKNIDSNGCGTYTISDLSRNRLILERDCSYESTTYYETPNSAVVIKKYEEFGVGGHPFVVFRFLANNNREYNYGGKYVDAKEFTNSIPLGRYDLKAYATVSQSSEINETLKIMDTIAASITLAKEVIK